jgi:hypothetical protein
MGVENFIARAIVDNCDRLPAEVQRLLLELTGTVNQYEVKYVAYSMSLGSNFDNMQENLRNELPVQLR